MTINSDYAQYQAYGNSQTPPKKCEKDTLQFALEADDTFIKDLKERDHKIYEALYQLDEEANNDSKR